MQTIRDLFQDILNDNVEPVLSLVTQYQLDRRLHCDCRECLLDVTALALTSLTPRYSVGLMRDLNKTDQEVREINDEVHQAVDAACARVRMKPNHPL